jgi:hypothetical protein
MKLDQYDTGIPKFRVFRHVEPPVEKVIPNTKSGTLIRDDDGRWYLEADEWTWRTDDLADSKMPD